MNCGFGCYPGHESVDYRADNFTPVVAAKEGTVSVALNPCLDPDGGGFNPCAGQGYGNRIYVDHVGGYQTRYAHLAQTGFNVWVGKAVARGEQMALSDNSGNSTGPHLHFELRVNGTAVDPYAGSTHWAGGDPFPMGYRDPSGTIHGPFPLDNTKIRNIWTTNAARLGSPIEDDWAYICSLGSGPPLPGPASATVATPGVVAAPTPLYGYQQRFERGYIYYCGDDPAQAVFYPLTFLPRILASTDAGAWNSTLFIRNLASSSTNVSVSFFRTNGTVLDSRTYIGLPANATWELRASNVVFDDLVAEGNTFSGAALVASDQDVAVIVRTEKSNRLTAYTGVSSLDPGSGWGRPATTLYAPTVMWNAWGTSWKSYLYVQNTTAENASVSITYCRQDNPSDCRTEGALSSLPPYGSARVDPGSEMGSGFWGFAQISSPNGKALAVVVTQEEDAAGASDYNALSSGATKVYLPSLMYAWYNWTSSFIVQNLGSQTASVDVTYYGENGQNYGCRLTNLRPGSSCLVTQSGYVSGCDVANLSAPPPEPSCAVPAGWHGTAILVGSQPLAAVVNQQRVDVPSHLSYSAFIGGGSTLYGPFAASSPSWDSCSDVQNVGSYGTYITSRYFYQDGSPAPGGSTRYAPPGGVVMFYVPNEGVGTNFVGSVRITRSNSVPIAGIHNLARKPAADDYGASYNLVQR